MWFKIFPSFPPSLPPSLLSPSLTSPSLTPPPHSSLSHSLSHCYQKHCGDKENNLEIFGLLNKHRSPYNRERKYTSQKHLQNVPRKHYKFPRITATSFSIIIMMYLNTVQWTTHTHTRLSGKKSQCQSAALCMQDCSLYVHVHTYMCATLKSTYGISPDSFHFPRASIQMAPFISYHTPRFMNCEGF